MTYPVSDHYDGEHFFNPEPTIRSGPARKSRGLLTLLLRRLHWRSPSEWSTWPRRIANTVYPPLTGGQPSVTFIGHSSFLIRLDGLTILTDPVFSRRCSPVQFAGPQRVRAPGIALKDLPSVDLILLSHNHYDHMDIASLRRLRRRFPGAEIVVPLGNQAFLAKKRIGASVELDWWQSHQRGETRITATPARHFAARTLWDRNETLWCGYFLTHRGKTLYFCGDTGYTRYFAEMHARLGAPDLALLPIGAYEPRWFMSPVHMNPDEAVRAFQDLGAKFAIGMHFGTFQLTAEAIDAPVKDLATALNAAGIPADRFITLDCGENLALGEGWQEEAGAGSGNRTRASSLGS